MHGRTVMHNFLLALTDDLELGQLLFDSDHDRVLVMVSIGGLRDHGSDLSASFS